MYWNLAIDHEGEDPARLIGRGLTSAIDAVRSAAAAVERWHKRRIAVRELMALDSRTLQDIGVCRGDIYSVADERLKYSVGEERPNAAPPRYVGTPLPEAWTVEGRKSAEEANNAKKSKLAA